jgi:hypothetical protein
MSLTAGGEFPYRALPGPGNDLSPESENEGISPRQLISVSFPELVEGGSPVPVAFRHGGEFAPLAGPPGGPGFPPPPSDGFFPIGHPGIAHARAQEPIPLQAVGAFPLAPLRVKRADKKAGGCDIGGHKVAKSFGELEIKVLPVKVKGASYLGELLGALSLLSLPSGGAEKRQQERHEDG